MNQFLNTICIVLGIILSDFQPLYAQERCIHCNMDIKSMEFRAKADMVSGSSVEFDAIECLINYLKTRDEKNFKALWVADYVSGNLIAAEEAFYLKSKQLPSPMGANLSAYSTQQTAKATQDDKGGKIYNWNELKDRFVSSKFGESGHSHHHHGPNNYAPSGIMGDHLHPKGGFMLSLRYMNMAMSGNLDGRDEISDEEIFERYMVAPQDMTMNMYMLGLMYAPSDRITIMLMQNFMQKDMDLTARMMMNGMTMLRDFSTSSSGIGDMKLGLLYGLHNSEKLSFHLNSNFNIPIGDIVNRDATPMMADAKLPYAMQLGTGTFDITIGGTLKGNFNDFAWGIQQLNTFRTGENSEEYRFGNLFELHSWLGYNISNSVGVSARFGAYTEGDIKGADPELNPQMVTTADPSNYGGEQIHGALGLNLLLAQDKLVLGAEFGLPLYQNYNGIFMDTDYAFNGCIKYTVF